MSEKNHRCDCHQLKELLHGPAGKPKESIVWVMAKHDEILNGTDENPHGLIEDVRLLKEQITRLKWIAVGAVGAINIGWIIFTHFSKP